MSGITRDGGLTATQKANAEVQNICDHVSHQWVIYGVAYRDLLVRPMLRVTCGYLFQVHITGHDYVHLRVYRSVENSFELTSYQLNKKRKDELIYF
ncbi:hypothetical protein XELAEV_18011256mg [Xenopus laevis]|uniref:Cystatin domain-containing protein n=1 Tax=Xenopus laevis TaxID=8355 RepID=A0A974DMA7_XENLA|nr:hypothetical protein XELAEV_18011256mg [Xenopus laevis]